MLFIMQEGRTALMAAAQGGHLHVLRLLLQQGADICLQDKVLCILIFLLFAFVNLEDKCFGFRQIPKFFFYAENGNDFSLIALLSLRKIISRSF